VPRLKRLIHKLFSKREDEGYEKRELLNRGVKDTYTGENGVYTIKKGEGV